MEIVMTDVILRVLQRQSDDMRSIRFVMETKFRDNDIHQNEVNEILATIDDIQKEITGIIDICNNGVKP